MEQIDSVHQRVPLFSLLASNFRAYLEASRDICNNIGTLPLNLVILMEVFSRSLDILGPIVLNPLLILVLLYVLPSNEHAETNV